MICCGVNGLHSVCRTYRVLHYSTAQKTPVQQIHETHSSDVTDTTSVAAALATEYYYYYYICLTTFFPGQPGYASTRKVNHSGFYQSERGYGGSGISWTICKSFAPCSRQITTPSTSPLSFYRPDELPAAQPTVSKH